jgi:branched-chain amino acid aminotransferase
MHRIRAQTNIMQIWINGEVVAEGEARISAHVAGATLGWGVFTTIGVWHGRAFEIERHLQRLRRDAERLQIPLHFDDAVLQQAAVAIIHVNAIARGIARITVLQGSDGRWNTDDGCDAFIMARPVAEDVASTRILRLVLSPFRIEARRATAGLKSTSYLDYQLAWQEASRSGFDEALLCNGSGAVSECSRANVFWVRDDVLHTPHIETGCLPGIGRELTLEWAAQSGLASRQGHYSLQELAAADEVFITSAAQGVRAVASLSLDANDAAPYEYASNGSVTLAMQQRWNEAVKKVVEAP